jgi:hypothetical protein
MKKYTKENWRCKSFLAPFIPSLSLSPKVFPTAAPGQCFWRNFFLFVAQGLISFVENFRHFSKKIGKKSTLYPVSNSLFKIFKSPEMIISISKIGKENHHNC